MKENLVRKSQRQSGLELLKIIAIFLIVVYHTIFTLRVANGYVPYNDYQVPLRFATTDFRNLFLAFFVYLGPLGNTIFFVCSAWFLTQSKKTAKRKAFMLAAEVLAVSLIILSITFIVLGGNLPLGLIVKSLLPNIFANNWYLTCYLLFLFVYPMLNSAIDKMSQKSLFRTALVSLVLYCGLGFVVKTLFFPSELILWCAIYFLVAYIQRYGRKFADSLKANIWLLVISVVALIVLTLVTNFLGLKIAFFSEKLTYWSENNNPFLIAQAVALLNLFRRCKFQSSAINYVSSLSLLIYIIHENLLLRTYLRPAVMHHIHETYGYDHLILWVIGLSVAIFILSFLCALIYDKTLRKLFARFFAWLYAKLSKLYLSLESRLLKLK